MVRVVHMNIFYRMDLQIRDLKMSSGGTLKIEGFGKLTYQVLCSEIVSGGIFQDPNDF